MAIKYTGVKELSESELFTLKRISEREQEKITRHFPDASISLIIKKYQKTGKRSKISVHSKVNNPKTIAKAEAVDWDIAKATHKIFDKLDTEISKKLPSKP